MNQIQAGKPSGAVSQAGSASAAAGKPIAISKSLLKLLKDIPVPQQKPEPNSKTERMPTRQLKQLTQNLSLKQSEICERTLTFIIKSAAKLHPDDVAECISAALHSNNGKITCMANDFIKTLNDHSLKVRCTRVALLDENNSVSLKAPSSLEISDDDCLKAYSIKIDLTRVVYPYQFNALQQIETLENDFLKSICIKTALCSYDQFSLGAVLLIETLKDDFLKAECIKTIRQDNYETFIKAFPLIANLQQEYRGELYKHAAERIQLTILCCDREEDLQNRAFDLIDSLSSESLKAECIRAVLSSDKEKIQLSAFDFIKTLNDYSLKVRCMQAALISKNEGISLKARAFLEISDDDCLKAHSIQTNLASVGYDSKSKALQQIETLKDEFLKSVCIKAALCSYSPFSLDAIPLIEKLKDVFLKAECIEFALNNRYETIFGAFHLIAGLPQEYREELYRCAAKRIQVIFLYCSDDKDLQNGALDLIVSLNDESLKADCIKTAFSSNNYDPMLRALDLIGSLNDPALRVDCTKTALNTRYWDMSLRAIPYIANLPQEYRGEFYSLAAKRIQAYLKSDQLRFSLMGVSAIETLNGDVLKASCIQAALESKYYEVREAAQKLAV